MNKKVKNTYTLYLVIPCYNEEIVLPKTFTIFHDKIKELIKRGIISSNSKVLFVNDGSTDRTWEIIEELSNKNKHIEGISLSRNRGHQNAILAGLLESKDLCDVTITMDCDGQHDINAIDDMLNNFENGYDVVYGVRKNRTGDGFFKKFFSELYYRLINLLGGEIIVNHADYRLTSTRVLNSFSDFKEVNIFLRGLFPLVGFKSTTIDYEQLDRQGGESHYTLKKMLTLAIDGITSLSVKPIRIITVFGVIVILMSFISLIYTSFALFDEDIIKTLSTMASVICCLLGIVMLSLGIVGEYVGKTYLETKHRPRYIISEKTYK